MSDPNLNIVAVPVDGMGQFLFRRRAMRQEIAITVERQRLNEGVVLDEFTGVFLEALATLKVLTVEAPEGSGMAPDKLDGLDPFDDESYGKVLTVWRALRHKEESFRRPGTPVPPVGEGAVGDVRPVVPADVQAGAD